MKQLKHYTIKHQIGQGGMSNVYLAHDPHNDKDVAIKLLKDNLTNDAEARSRFAQEAQLVASLDHPTIIPILDFGEWDGHLYLVMPYMPSGSLRERLAAGALTWQASLHIIEQIASALDTAHHHNVIHRDVKPHNILLGADGSVCLADFGVARLLDTSHQEEATITLIGTPEFMAPEQTMKGDVTPATDIYQLGVTLFYMLTGQRPYEGQPFSVIAQHITQTVPSAEAMNDSLPVGTDDIIRKAMAKDPRQRYQTAGEMVMAMQTLPVNATRTSLFALPISAKLPNVQLSDSTATPTAEPPAPPPPRRWMPRWAMTLVLLVFLALGSIGAGLGARQLIDGNNNGVQAAVEQATDGLETLVENTAPLVSAAEENINDNTPSEPEVDDTPVQTTQLDENNGNSNNNGDNGGRNDGNGDNDGNGNRGSRNGGRGGGNRGGNGNGNGNGNGGGGNGNGGNGN